MYKLTAILCLKLEASIETKISSTCGRTKSENLLACQGGNGFTIMQISIWTMYIFSKDSPKKTNGLLIISSKSSHVLANTNLLSAISGSVHYKTIWLVLESLLMTVLETGSLNMIKSIINGLDYSLLIKIRSPFMLRSWWRSSQRWRGIRKDLHSY